MEHRRRAADFSHLLETSYTNTTDCRSALESVTDEANSSAQLNNVISTNSKTSNEDKFFDSCSVKSTILAGYVAGSDSQRTSESSYKTARTASLVGGFTSRDSSMDSCRPLQVPSAMNRAITTEFSPQPDLDLSQTAVESRSSGEMNRNVLSCSEKSSDESRDTNYNIRGDREQLKCSTKHQLLQTSRDKLRSDTPTACSFERKDTRSLLTKLDNIRVTSDAQSPKSDHKMFRRLSQEFFYSPRTFTERLVTIIDESETGCAVGADTSGVNLSRMTKEFRKMCKFIRDESMPEMAPSFSVNSIYGNSRYLNDDIFEDYHERPETIVESPTESHPSVECKTPILENARKIYRKTPLNIFKDNYRANRPMWSPDSPNSTRYFEYLENKCLSDSPKLAAKNRSKTKSLRRSLSTSDIEKEAKDVLIKCEEQLRSLENITTTEYETFDSHQGHEARLRKIEIESSTVHNTTVVRRDEHNPNYLYAQSQEIEDGELSSSLLIEKELQRRRCFELATLMQEIEAEAKESNEEYPKALERHGIDPETAFMKTISSCLDYKNCLSVIRQSSNLKRNDALSTDSGIDARSFGRTLCASAKKSFNDASAKNVEKHKRNYTSTCKYQKSGMTPLSRARSNLLGNGKIIKIDRKAVSSDNLCQDIRSTDGNPSPSANPRRPEASLRPISKSLAKSRSPSHGKRSPTLQIPLKTRLFKTPERKRPQEIGAKSLSPETNIMPSKSVLQEIKKSPEVPKSSPSYLRSGIQSSRLSPTLRSSGRERVEKCNEAKSPSKSPASAQETKISKNKFFVTPGRTPCVKKKRQMKTYFPNMDEHIYQESSQRIMKSLHAPGLYRMGYDTVISPIRMYIHGTDMNLIHNNHERKNEMMLTPSKDKALQEKLKFKLASSRKSPLRKSHRSSDNENLNPDDCDENIKEPGFTLPKANYNQPAQVQTVNESPNRIRGARTRGLLQSMQNRVVIRHKSKKLGKYGDNVSESCGSDTPTELDTSMHVLKAAEKTNFTARRRIP